jgi:hypothetical protein
VGPARVCPPWQYKSREGAVGTPYVAKILSVDIFAKTQDVARVGPNLRLDLHNLTNMGVRSGQSVP